VVKMTLVPLELAHWLCHVESATQFYKTNI